MTPNGDMISRDDAIALIEGFQRELCPVGMYGRYAVYGSDRDKFDDWQFIIDELEKLPAVDAESAVHGRWEFCGDDYLVCSVCGARYYKGWLIQSYCTGPGSDQMDGFLYCPHCNALLDGGENND